MQYRQVQTIGGKGLAPDRFTATLRGLAVNEHGQIYAGGDAEIKVFDSAGRLQRRWPTSGPVLSVAVASDGTVYVGQPGQIGIFTGAGKPLHTWRDEKLLRRVTAIGVSQDYVLAGDAADRSIRRFDRSGKFLNNIGKDSPLNGLLIPNGVVDFAIDVHGKVHVANPGKASRRAVYAGWTITRAYRTLRWDRSGGVYRLLQSDQRGRRRRHLHHGESRSAG